MNLENVKFNADAKPVLNIGDPMGRTNVPRTYSKLSGEPNMSAIMLPVEVKKEELPQFMKACKMLHVHYIFPTMPHKKDVVPLLDGVDESSRIFQSVNVVRINKGGTSHGMGVDGKGALNTVLSSGIQLVGGEVFILGSGSTSGMIGPELSKCSIRKLTILNRTVEKAQGVADILNTHTSMETKALVSTPENLDQAAGTVQFFLQVAPLGMTGYGRTHEYLGFTDHLSEGCVVFDIIIDPVDTPVISAAKARGLRTVPELKMLVGQMEVVFRSMFGVELTQRGENTCIQELYQFLGVTAD